MGLRTKNTENKTVVADRAPTLLDNTRSLHAQATQECEAGEMRVANLSQRLAAAQEDLETSKRIETTLRSLVQG